ncbi:MAG TPA: helix-turn-helix domain-containing GNAT family N-acetyltransferase [Euzebyales bacterium]|nr:helix-turn-helix domain-containing GNAT family N-acetyltransferase [Euzebyales bacterium]
MIDAMDHVGVLRRFNRSFTTRIGVLEERFLGLDRPLGHARVLFEIGTRPDDAMAVRDLRADLDLDSGYLSRILRALEADGLVEVVADPADARQHIARLTVEGGDEWSRLDERADRLAAAVVDGLAPRHRDRLAVALGEADRLLAAAQATFELTDPRTPDAREALTRYFEELDSRFTGGFDPGAATEADAPALSMPAGRFVLVRVDGRLAGCGGVQVLGDGIAEIKRMWIADAMRGLGLGARLLRTLEEHGVALGCATVRLDTNGALTDAIAMYRRAGYRDIPRYNSNPYAELFFEKHLTSR